MSSRAIASNVPLNVSLVWLAGAVLLGASGVLARFPAPRPQILLLALTVATIVAGTRRGVIRDWIDALPMRAFALLHLTRFVGIYFLYLGARGELSMTFVNGAAWGDILAASGALLLLLFAREPDTRAKRSAWLAWNSVAMLDWFFVLGSIGVIVAAGEQQQLAPLLRLPLSLLPTFLVPMLIASQVFIFRRLLSKGANAR